MKILDRNEYNQMIKKFNKNEEIDTNSVLDELTNKYNGLLCNLSDYEEIVMLINICIAEDRKNLLEKLHNHYSKVKKILNEHGDYSIEDYYIILYCMGVFSFKFHNYDEALNYFEKCEEQLIKTFDNPYVGTQRDIYVKMKILKSYSLEYEFYLDDGSKQAIDNILDQPLTPTVEDEEALLKELKGKPEDVVLLFFTKFESKIYQSADEEMQKEILHVLSHCFSEYSNYLKNSKKNGHAVRNTKKIFLWERIAEKFIESLGEAMITCKAIISSEHGLYWTALEDMKKQYVKLDEKENEKKAELAFYIYYFCNQLGIDQSEEIEDYKQYFVDFAKSSSNKDTTVYAWIVEFREKLAQALKINGRESLNNLLTLEELIENAKFQSTEQSYLHPQIMAEMHRLLLAYQILRSYLIINENGSNGDIDNNLFEKCVLFNKLMEKNNDIMAETTDLSHPEHFMLLHNVRLCVQGITEEIKNKLEKSFCTNISFINGKDTENHKIVICTNDEQFDQLEKMEKTHLILFIFCEDKYLPQIRKIVNENTCVETDIVRTFKIAYIQETLEQCYQFSNKWDEFYVMAPITDNSTFAFQSQGIKEFLEIKNSPQSERGLFSDDNGYVTNEIPVLSSVQKIHYEVDLAEDNSITRILYFSGNCLYEYRQSQKSFFPYKIFNDSNEIKVLLDELQKRETITNKKRKACDCRLVGNLCLCDEWAIDIKKEKISELLMKFSIDLPSYDEKFCTIVRLNKGSEEEKQGSFLLILSKSQEKSYSLRLQLGRIQNKHRIIQDNEFKENTSDKRMTEVEKNNLLILRKEINDYVEDNKKYYSDGTVDLNQINSLCEKINMAIASSKEDDERDKSYWYEWHQIRYGKT